MISFFSEDLSAELVTRRKFGTADGATLNLNGVTINLRVANENEEVLGDASQLHYGYHHLGLEVEDLDAAYNDLKNRGYHFTSPPKELGDIKFAFFEGPEHVILELIQTLA